MSQKQFSFEKLEVWQSARALTARIYSITKHFPPEEKFGLTQQMRRAALSVCSNLAERSTRISPKDQAHFTVMSFSSMMELLNDVIISTDLNYLTEELNLEFRTDIQRLAIKLSNLKKSQLDRVKKV